MQLLLYRQGRGFAPPSLLGVEKGLQEGGEVDIVFTNASVVRPYRGISKPSLSAAKQTQGRLSFLLHLNLRGQSFLKF